MMIRYIPLLLLSLFLLSIIQTNVNLQSIIAQSRGTNDSILSSTSNTNVNNTPKSQDSLVQNNPGYAIYIPGSGFLKNTINNIGNASLNNVTTGPGHASIDARISLSNDSDKRGLVQNNPGYAIYIPGSGFLKNTTEKNINASNIQSNNLLNGTTSAHIGHDSK